MSTEVLRYCSRNKDKFHMRSRIFCLDAFAKRRFSGNPAASYESVLLRAHLGSLTPLPKDELLALKRSVAELGAIGRNLNQIARAANRGEPVVSLGREDVRMMLRICEGLRDHVKAHFLQHRIRYRRNQLRRGLYAIQLTQMILKYAHPARVHRDDLLVESRKAPLILCNY